MSEFNTYLEQVGEFGVVDQVNYPMVIASGLPMSKINEIVLFETGEVGEVFALAKHHVEILLLSQNSIRVGTKITRTNKSLRVPVGNELLGCVIDPLGNPISSPDNFTRPQEERDLDAPPPGMTERSRIKEPFLTGMTIVDMMVPLGKGQKELVIGDRKTGKSSFLITAIKTQVQHGAIAVYAAIGRKKSDIKRLYERFKKEGILDKIVIVASSSYDSPSLIYFTPYTAMALAEYFREVGHDVLLVLDDLSTHAKFYREISLIAKNFPGRDSYPGDIFYKHARLLERAGNFHHNEKGEVSITCLPVVETVEGDFTGYIATNLMGMTDGHIFFDSNIYYKGRRPAINVQLSVTRVGRQTQNKIKRDITRELISFLTLYDKMQNLSHFGAELTSTVKNVLTTGEKIYRFFDQQYTLTVPSEVQLILFCMLWLKLLTPEEEVGIDQVRLKLIKAYETEDTKKLFSEMLSAKSFNETLGLVSKNQAALLAIIRPASASQGETLQGSQTPLQSPQQPQPQSEQPATSEPAQSASQPPQPSQNPPLPQQPEPTPTPPTIPLSSSNQPTQSPPTPPASPTPASQGQALQGVSQPQPTQPPTPPTSLTSPTPPTVKKRRTYQRKSVKDQKSKSKK